MRSFDILVDSSCDLPIETITEHALTVLPMSFTLGQDAYVEDYWQSLSADDFYNRLAAGETAVTSQISRGVFLDVFTEKAQKGLDSLFICLSSGISSTYANACGAATEIMEAYPDRKVLVVDSLNATLGEGLLTVLAAQKAATGASITQVFDYLEETKHRLFSLFTVDDLMFLHRGGRVSRISAVAGSVLGVKPMLWIAPDGTLKMQSKVRGRKASIDAFVSNMAKILQTGAVPNRVTICHGNCLAEAQQLKEMIARRFGIDDVIINLCGAVVGAHAGPNVIALFFESDRTRQDYTTL